MAQYTASFGGKMNMNRLFGVLAALALLTSGFAYADCGSDKGQALSLIGNLKSTAAANDQAKTDAMANQLGQIMERMSSQGCNSQVLEIYQTMQREGVTGR